MPMPDQNQAERERAIKIATVALHRAQAGDLEDAASYIKRLNGTNGLVVALMAWIDTYAGRVYPEHKPGEAFRLRWLHTPTGDVQAAQEVSAAMRWAGQLIGARMADDEAGFYALLRVPAEGAELGEGVMALLHIVATSINDPQLVRRTAVVVAGEDQPDG